MAYTPVTRSSSKDQINQANILMRSQPWFAQWFAQRGLNPNVVHLTDAQRQELGNLAAQNGMPLGPDGMKIDPAGNIHVPTGFSSQPTWLKAVEIGGVAAPAALFAAPAIAGVLGGGSATAGTASAASAAGTMGTGGTLAGAAGATGTGLSLSNYLTRAIPSLASAGLGIYSANKQASSNQAAINAQTQANQAALEYTKQKDAQDRADFLNAQRANYAQYVAREQRFAPYRASGEAANMTIAHLLGLPNVNVAQPPPLPSYLQDNTMSPLVGGR